MQKQVKCPHCQEKMKSVDHMATQCDRMLTHDYMRRHNEALRCIYLQLCVNYGLISCKKIKNYALQDVVASRDVEVRVGSRIQADMEI